MQQQYQDLFAVLGQHIEIAEIFKHYGLHKYTFKEICALSDLEKWRAYTENVSTIIGEKIDLVNCGNTLIEVQKKIVKEYAVTSIRSIGFLGGRDSWKGCLEGLKKLHVNFARGTCRVANLQGRHFPHVSAGLPL